MDLDVPAWRLVIDQVVSVSRILPLPVYLGTDSIDKERRWVSRKTRRVLASWGELVEVHGLQANATLAETPGVLRKLRKTRDDIIVVSLQLE